MRAGDRVGPDPEMVAAARAGDQRALDLLVGQCLPLLYNIVGRALDGNDDVDDVVQETLLRVVRGLGELRDPAAFRSWLVAIAVRQVRDREQARKASWHHQTGLDDAELIPDPASDFASVTILRLGLTDQRREIAEATRWLDHDDRTLLALWWLEETGDIGRTELADALGLSRQHAAVKVQRMKEQLETSRTVVRALGAADGCAELHELATGWDGVPGTLWRKRFARHIRGCGTCGHLGGMLLPMDRLLSGLPLLPVPISLAALRPGPAPLPGHLPPAHTPPAAPTPPAHTPPAPAPGHAPAAHTPPTPAHTPPAPTAPTPAPGHAPTPAPAAAHAPGAVPAGSSPIPPTQRTAPRSRPPRRSGAHRGVHRLRPRLPHGPFAVPAAAVGAVAAVAAGALLAVHLATDPSAPADTAASVPTAATTSAVAPPTTPAPSPSRTTPSARPTTSRPATAPPTTHAPVKAAPPPAPPASSARKGVGVWSFDGVDAALDQSGASWYYTWSTTHPGINGPGFVPMVWGADSATPAALAQAKQAGPYLLGFNEPDMGGQSNMTVNQALSLWPKLESAGKVLGSPAVAYGGDTPGGWLDRFMSGAAQKGYRVDFITLHWYGGDFTTPDAVAQLRSYVQAVHNRYHKPIWLTEFALTDFSSGAARYPTDQQQAAFLTAATKMLDGLPYVQRYAWFGLPAKDGAASTGLFHSGPAATDAGRAFEAAR